MFNQLSPRNNLWVVRRDGIASVFTYDKENNVAAWSRMTFGDGVLSACAISTGGFKSVFLAVKRGNYLCLERLDPNELGTNNWLDCVPISDSIALPDDLNHSAKFESIVKTTPIFLEGNVRILDIKIYLLNSIGGKFRISGFDQNSNPCADQWRNILPLESEFLQNPSPRDCRFCGSCDTGYLEEASIEISSDSPAPFEIAAIGINAKG